MALMANVWRRLPTIVRAVLVGGFVMSMATVPCGVLLRANFAIWPAVPWSTPLVALYLSLYWLYLQGIGWPSSTAQSRRAHLRAPSLSGRAWRWSLLAGSLAWASVLGARILVDLLFATPRDSLSVLSPYPLPTVLCYIVAVSVMAGVAEEAGCRGYMQVPIERRHGPRIAILVVGGAFWLFHAPSYVGHWKVFLGLAWFYLAASLVFGTLAHLSGSIRPGVVLHAAANLVGFALVWWFESRPPTGSSTADGPTPVLMSICGATLASILAACWAYRRLALVVRGAKAAVIELEGPR